MYFFFNEKRKEESYEAVTAVLQALQYYQQIGKTVQYAKEFDIYIPVVIVRGNLVESLLNAEGEMIVNDIKEGQLLYKSHAYENFIPMIEIITEDMVENFCQKVREDMMKIASDYQEDLSELFENHPTDPRTLIGLGE